VCELARAEGAGAIDADEMHEALTKVGACITLEEVEEMINMVDDDGSGEIEFAEFCAIMETCVDGEPEYTYKVPPLSPLPSLSLSQPAQPLYP
jgi:hypothetical protein